MTIDLEDFEFAVADRFGVCGRRGNTRVVRTPRELVDFLVERTGPLLGVDAASLKQRAFYRVRRYLSHRLALPAAAIQPTSRLTELFPAPERRPAEWAALRRTLGMPEAPRLARPAWLERALTAATGAAWLAAVAAGVRLLPVGWSLLAGSAVTVAFGAAALRLTQRYCVLVVPPDLTVGDLASYCSAYGSPLLGGSRGAPTRSQVIEVVRDLARLELAVPVVRWDAPWEDLFGSATAP